MSSVSTALTMSELRITLAKQQLETTKEQGKAAIALIEASSPAPAAAPTNAAAGVGQNLNVVG